MSHWSFGTAEFAVALVATAGLLAWAFLTMRKAEATADELKRSR